MPEQIVLTGAVEIVTDQTGEKALQVHTIPNLQTYIIPLPKDSPVPGAPSPLDHVVSGLTGGVEIARVIPPGAANGGV